jgi:hypothetical protein
VLIAVLHHSPSRGRGGGSGGSAGLIAGNGVIGWQELADLGHLTQLPAADVSNLRKRGCAAWRASVARLK